MKEIRRKHWMAKYKTRLKIASFIFVIVIFHLGYEILKSLFSKADSNTIGVYGALFGALLGGVISLGGTIWVHNRQLKSGAEIIRKRDIYIPLYNDLVRLNNILFITHGCSTNKFPPLIDIDNQYNNSSEIPTYNEWIKIKNTSYLLEVSEILIKKMEELSQIIRDYNEDFTEAVDSINQKWKNILHGETFFYDDNHIISVLRYTLQESDIDYLADCFGISDFTKGTDWKAVIRKKLDMSLKDDTNFSSIKAEYLIIELKQKEIIEILKLIINTTIQKFER